MTERNRTIDGKVFIRATAVAKSFGVTVPTIRNWIKKEKLEGLKDVDTERWWVSVESVSALAKELYGDDD